jgi:hypothetical protein
MSLPLSDVPVEPICFFPNQRPSRSIREILNCHLQMTAITKQMNKATDAEAHRMTYPTSKVQFVEEQTARGLSQEFDKPWTPKSEHATVCHDISRLDGTKQLCNTHWQHVATEVRLKLRLTVPEADMLHLMRPWGLADPGSWNPAIRQLIGMDKPRSHIANLIANVLCKMHDVMLFREIC